MKLFKKYMEENGYNVASLFEQTELAVAATFVYGFHGIRLQNSRYLPHRHSPCELFGIDLIIDESLNPYVLEVNISPAMGTDSELDYVIKNRLLHDTLRMWRLIECDSTSKDP